MILSRYWFIFSIINMVSFIICLEFFILHEYNNFDSYIYGQTAFTNSSGLVDKSTNASFNAEGTINTILFSQNTSNNSKPLVKDINTNHSSKYLLGGKWRLDVLNDNVTYFKSNFTMIDTVGHDIHFHTIVYKPGSTQPITLVQQGKPGILFQYKNNNTAGFNSYVDIYTNGVLEWEDVPIKVTLMNEKVIMMDIKDKKTVEHFLKNPIYGLINSVDLIHQ
jgi:predicted RNA-binding protein